MTDMAGTDREQFEVVRRGYDIDQVDEFLVRQAEAWRERLHTAEQRIVALEAEVAELQHLGSEVEAARKQQEALTLTFQTAAQAQDEMLAKAELEAADHRRATEQEMRQLRFETEAETRRLLADATSQNEELITAAKAEADELLISNERFLLERQADLDANHVATSARYRQAEEALSSNVEELNSMRVALVAGLEAIASGGLAALNEVSHQLAAVGIVDDESEVKELIDESDVAAIDLHAIAETGIEAEPDTEADTDTGPDAPQTFSNDYSSSSDISSDDDGPGPLAVR